MRARKKSQLAELYQIAPRNREREGREGRKHAPNLGHAVCRRRLEHTDDARYPLLAQLHLVALVRAVEVEAEVEDGEEEGAGLAPALLEEGEEGGVRGEGAVGEVEEAVGMVGVELVQPRAVERGLRAGWREGRREVSSWRAQASARKWTHS